jgi:CRISPR/Cas system CMR-associated protein Cmr3 (group 5 of RAMP superfamily)
MLYTAAHERMGNHSETTEAEEFTLAMSVRAASSDPLPEPQEWLQLGSQGRSVTCSAEHSGEIANQWDGTGFVACQIDEMTDSAGHVRYSVVLLSPAWFGEDENRIPHHLTGDHDLPGDLVSAVVPKPVTFGGWDARNNAPAPMRRYFASGSTFYFQANGDAEAVYAKLQRIAGKGVGCHTEVGLGAAAIGTWRFADTGGSGA